MNEHVYQMCEAALSFLEMTDEEKKQNFEHANFTDEDYKMAAVDVIYSLQHFAKTGEQRLFLRDKTQYMFGVAAGLIQ